MSSVKDNGVGVVSAYALAGSEENARGHLVVTAPTGGRVPIVLTSRAASVRARIASCAVAMLAAHARRQPLPAMTA